MDHASWRFILKIGRAFFKDHAHQKYLVGLAETGISTERIPSIEEMDECLKQFGWRAVAVSGFIPPGVFMEFLSLGILPIACDMRQIGHLAYTPAPDIVHEAAGHAPIVADPAYRAYLRTYGEVSRRAIFTYQDMEVYQAIRALSDIKEDPASTPAQIQKAQDNLDRAWAANTEASESTLLSRMGWWTFEYGLVGSMEDPKLYGAGLLSSVFESYHCLGPEVKRIPFSIRCIDQTYDITRPQPQLFVAPDFRTLEQGLEDLAEQMAFRRGGIEGLEKARAARTVTTVELETGVQVSGVLESFERDSAGEPCFLKWSGPVQLACADRELSGQGVKRHGDGFSSPIGRLKDGRSVPELSDEELQSITRLEYASGIVLEGKPTSMRRGVKLPIIVTFDECRITWGSRVLYEPSWGPFDLVCGNRVRSVFGGAADRHAYLAATGGFHQSPGKQKTNLTEANRPLNALYKSVRELREKIKKPGDRELAQLDEVAEELESKFKEDWLLRYELLELASQWKLSKPAWEPALRTRLAEASKRDPHVGELLERGYKLL